MTTYLTLEELLRLCRRLGLGPVADPGLLDSAASRPRSTVFGEDAYSTIEAKAAALLHSLVRNHALVDGNKRLGWIATVQFLSLNGYSVQLDDDSAYALVIGVAEGRLDVAGIVEAMCVCRAAS